jgi:hypothetical protein
LLLAGAAAKAASPPVVCLPPVFDGGQRLHDLDGEGVYWLELLLRQHEICWRQPARADEVRIALVGSSAVFGHPLPAGEALSARLNAHFVAANIPAHVFNLAFVTTYQLKDALIIHESLRYRPQLILYAPTLAEFVHLAPIPYRIDEEFFRQNRQELARLAAEQPPGVTALIARYDRDNASAFWALDAHLEQTGAFIRAAIRRLAMLAREQLLPEPNGAAPAEIRQSPYDCAKTRREAADMYHDWQSWNILAYLERLRAVSGINVLIVNWPLPYQPVEDCYNSRFPVTAVHEYNEWMVEQTRLRGLPYLDLHNLLPPDEFIDSLHVTASGQRTIAEELAPTVDALVVKILQAHGDAAAEEGTADIAPERCCAESGCTN